METNMLVGLLISAVLIFFLIIFIWIRATKKEQELERLENLKGIVRGYNTQYMREVQVGDTVDSLKRDLISSTISSVQVDTKKYDDLRKKLVKCMNESESRKKTVLGKALIKSMADGDTPKETVVRLVGVASEVESRKKQPIGKLLMKEFFKILEYEG